MGRIRTVLAFLAAFPLIPSTLVATANATTKVVSHGRNITITVPIDGIGIDKKTAATWKANAESVWNAAFDSADNPFKDCMTLKLVVDVEVHGYDDPPRDDRHRVFGTYGATRNQPAGSIVRYGNPYQQAADGNFDEVFNASPQANFAAHEVGHLLGLPDEYTETGTNPRRTQPFPGRENTLMADVRGRIDATLLRRLVDQLRNATHQIPDCWKGKLRAHAEGNVYNDWADVSFSFSETADGAITGKGQARMTHFPRNWQQVKCVHERKQTPDEFDVTVGGRREGNEFAIQLTTTTKATIQFSGVCNGKRSAGPPVAAGAFTGGGVPALLPIKVRADDGAKQTLHATVGNIAVSPFGATVEADGTIEIEHARDECPMGGSPNC